MAILIIYKLLIFNVINYFLIKKMKNFKLFASVQKNWTEGFYFSKITKTKKGVQQHSPLKS